MSPRTLKLAIVVTAAIMIAVQVRTKARPTPDDINARARVLSGSVELGATACYAMFVCAFWFTFADYRIRRRLLN